MPDLQVVSIIASETGWPFQASTPVETTTVVGAGSSWQGSQNGGGGGATATATAAVVVTYDNKPTALSARTKSFVYNARRRWVTFREKETKELTVRMIGLERGTEMINPI
jgi:hypothetical protein